MDNFKFKVNGIQTNIQAVLEPFHPGRTNGYGIGTISGLNTTTSSPGFQVDGTQGKVGRATCNERYTKNNVDIFKSSGGFSIVTPGLIIPSDYCALARYQFFSSNQSGTYNFNNIPIPDWASYIRVLLIGAGGGGVSGSGFDRGGGGAGEFVLMEADVKNGPNTYSIQIGQGGSGVFSGGGSAGGPTALYNIGNEPISAQGGSGGPSGAGGSTPIAGQMTYNFQNGFNTSVAVFTRSDGARVIRAEGAHGTSNGGGSSTTFGPAVGYFPKTLDDWFGFEMNGSSQISLVHEKINNQHGIGGDQYGTSGKDGCACVFYFAVKPDDWVLPSFPIGTVWQGP